MPFLLPALTKCTVNAKCAMCKRDAQLGDFKSKNAHAAIHTDLLTCMDSFVTRDET